MADDPTVAMKIPRELARGVGKLVRAFTLGAAERQSAEGYFKVKTKNGVIQKLYFDWNEELEPVK